MVGDTVQKAPAEQPKPAAPPSPQVKKEPSPEELKRLFGVE